MYARSDGLGLIQDAEGWVERDWVMTIVGDSSILLGKEINSVQTAFALIGRSRAVIFC